MRAIRIMVNWVALVTLPVWIIPYATFKAVKSGSDFRVLKGREWFWE